MNDNFDLYSKEVMKHFTRPKNIGVIKDADGVGTVGNPRCGDVMKVYIKIGRRPILISKSKKDNSIVRQSQKDVHSIEAPDGLSMALATHFLRHDSQSHDKRLAIGDKQEEYIKDIKVQTLGCGAAIATSSIATEMVKGKSLDEALKLTNQEVAKKLGGLPPAKMHCSLLAEEGIKKAIGDYKSKISKF